VSPIARARCLMMRGIGVCQASAPGCVRRSRLRTLLPCGSRTVRFRALARLLVVYLVRPVNQALSHY